MKCPALLVKAMSTETHQGLRIVMLFVGVFCCLFEVTSALCPKGCASCINGDSICDSCVEGFWLNGTQCFPCPKNCKSCANNFDCQSCMPKFFGLGGSVCKHNCSTNCTDSGCYVDSGYCYECPPGRYGSLCNHDCSLCRNSQCDLRMCPNGCMDGYYLDISGSQYPHCSPCLKTDCVACLNSTFCTQCNDSYFVRTYISIDGSGEADCQPCTSIHPCTDCESILNCSICDHVNGKLVCSRCQDSFVLQQTQCVKKVPCPHTCIGECKEHGHCIGGCINGYVGRHCDYRCSRSCQTCQTQISCETCEDGFYREQCDKTCSPTCISGESHTCRLYDGFCLNGCSLGTWGDQCQNNCSTHCRQENGTLNLCHRDGSCIYGCIEEYNGSECYQTTTTSTGTSATTDQMMETIVNNTNGRGILGAAIGGSIAGVLMIVALTVATVFYLHKRKSLSKGNQENNMNTYYNMSMEPRQAIEPEDIRIAEHRTSSLSQQRANLYEHLADENRQNPYSQLDRQIDEASQVEEAVQENNEYYNV